MTRRCAKKLRSKKMLTYLGFDGVSLIKESIWSPELGTLRDMG